MKAAIVSFDFGEYCIRLASALAQDAEVTLLLHDQAGKGHLSKMDPAVSFRPFAKPRLRQPLHQLRMVCGLVRQIRKSDPDVIHVQQGHLWFNLALPFLRRHPVVLTVHDPRHHLGDRGARNTPQALVDYGFRRATRIIAHGQQQKRVLVDRCGLSDRIIDVIPHIALGDEADQADVEEHEKTILFFGRIWNYKGLEYLIRAAPTICSAVPGARIVIAGQGDSFDRYRRMMANPDYFVVHNEFVSDDGRARLFRQASVVVLPYVEASQSGVIPLAYRFAKPVVATTVGGLPEMVEHGRTGLLVPPRDDVALAQAVISLLRNDPLRRKMGAAGARKIDHDWAPAVIARQTLAVYGRAVEAA